MDLLNAHGIGGAPIRATSQIVLTPGTQDIVKPNGNYTKGFKVPGEPNLLASNILAGKSIFGVTGTGKTIDNVSPGDNILNDNTIRAYFEGNNSSPYTKIKETQVLINGGFRVTYIIESSWGDYAHDCVAYFAVYVNDGIKGTVHSILNDGNSRTTGKITITDDINGVKSGDKIQIWCRAESSLNIYSLYCYGMSLKIAQNPMPYTSDIM